MTESNVRENILRIEDIFDQKFASQNADQAKNDADKRLEQKVKNCTQEIPKGKPKSGRIWKEQKTRFSSIIKTRGLRLSLEKKQKLREDLKRVKELSRNIKEQKQAIKEAKKQRRIENLRRAEENNRKKSEIVQVIKNTAKIKRTKKKQLRMIEKRDN